MEEQNENKFRFPLEFGINRVGFGLGVGCGFGIGIGRPFNFSGVPVMGQIIDGLQQGVSMIRFGDIRGLVRKTGADVGIGCGVGLGYGWGAAGMFVSNDTIEILKTNFQKIQGFIQKSSAVSTSLGHDADYAQQITQQQRFENSDAKGSLNSNMNSGKNISTQLDSIVESQQKQLHILQEQLDYKQKVDDLQQRVSELEEVVCQIKPKHPYCKNRKGSLS